MELLLKARPSRGDRDADAGPCWRPVHRGGLLRPGPRMPSPIRLSLGEALRRPAGEPRGGRARAEVEAHRPDAAAFAHPAPAVGPSSATARRWLSLTASRGAARERLNLRLTLQQPASRVREQRVYSQAKEGVRVAEQGLRAAEDRILLRVAADYLAVLQGDALLGRDAVAGVGTEAPAGFPEPPAGRRGDRGRRAAAVSAVKWRRTAAGLAHREREAAAVVRRPRSDGEVEVLQPGVELTSPRLRNCSPAPMRRGPTFTRPERTGGRAGGGQAEGSLPAGGDRRRRLRRGRDVVLTQRYGFAALRFTVPLLQSGRSVPGWLLSRATTPGRAELAGGRGAPGCWRARRHHGGHHADSRGTLAAAGPSIVRCSSIPESWSPPRCPA